jgi:hypothetical protein
MRSQMRAKDSLPKFDKNENTPRPTHTRVAMIESGVRGNNVLAG